jgi:phosphoserine phosphatase
MGSGGGSGDRAAPPRQRNQDNPDRMGSLPRWELACFDLDGTLVRGTSVSQFLADRLGEREQLLKLEERYAAGEISNAQVAIETAASLGGRTVGWVSDALAAIPCISGIDETVVALRARNIAGIIATITWRFAAEMMRERHGFLAACGTEMHQDDAGVLSGRVSRQFDEQDKRRFVEDYCARNEIALERCVAIGDSRSDIPLFGAVGFSIALNATAAARRAANVAIDTDCLTDILDLIPDSPMR